MVQRDLLAMAHEVMEADKEMRRTLAHRVVASAWTNGRRLGTVVPTGPALPFIDAVTMAPRTGPGLRPTDLAEAFAAYA